MNELWQSLGYDDSTGTFVISICEKRIDTYAFC